MNKKIIVLLFGAGPMAADYARVLEKLDVEYVVFGRSASSAINFKATTGHVVSSQEFDEYELPKGAIIKAIVAVSLDQLALTAKKLLERGVKEILLEKPGGISLEEINLITNLSKSKDANVLIALNRRFYSSTIKAKEIISADGGLTSCTFDFTEWVDSIPKHFSDKVYKTWVVSNPIHVIDHFINFCGLPKELNAYITGESKWHSSGVIFAGAGITKKNILFSYHADWNSAGRWSVELFTRKRKLIFCPMEGLNQVIKNQTIQEKIDIDDEHDLNFKPGLWRQVDAFLGGKYDDFCTIHDHRENFYWYYKIAGYESLWDV